MRIGEFARSLGKKSRPTSFVEKTHISQTASFFEDKLFANGRLDITSDDVKRKIPRLREEQKTWLQVFNGKIPVSWGDVEGIWKPDGIATAFSEAAEHQKDLSRGLILAGITHPHGAVVEEVILSQKLDFQLLTAAFMRGYSMEVGGIHRQWANRIRYSQKAKGVDEMKLVLAYHNAIDLVS